MRLNRECHSGLQRRSKRGRRGEANQAASVRGAGQLWTQASCQLRERTRPVLMMPAIE
jgi:hypothetical protein